jgi:hypothetical protein
MWFYVDRILIGYQRAEAVANDRPRGNLSDLYPRWLGARELLLHRRNPYSEDITLEIQKGYYGRALDPSRPNDPKDRQGFAYPAYVVFLLAPLVGFPFDAVRIFFHWLLVVITAGTVWLWLRVLRWRLSWVAVAGTVALTLGSFPAVQGIKLQQLSLLVAGLLAGSVACVAMDFLFAGGALLALATIKPQLAWIIVAWLLLWAVSDWRARRKLVYGFGLVMVLLLVGAEILLPGWWRMFAQAIGQYHQYTQNQSVVEVMLNQILGSVVRGNLSHFAAQVIAVVGVLAGGVLLWKLRRERSDAPAFGCATALALALTVLVVPMFAPYNQILLLPAILLMVRRREQFLSQFQGRRWAYQIGVLLVGWQWLASAVLTAAYWFVSPEWALERWNWPFFATFALPIWIFMLLFFYAFSGYVQRQSHPLLEAPPHESQAKGVLRR